jgi:excisionase family DNA binding protein
MTEESEGKGRESASTTHLLDLDHAAKWLGVSPRLVRELWARRELGGIKVGRFVRFRDADLRLYVERHHVGPDQ